MRLIGWSGRLQSIIFTKTSVTWLILNLVDLALTLVIIGSWLGYEGNPLLQLLPLPLMAIVKIGLALLVVVIFGARCAIMRALNIGMSLVVIWNLGCLVATYIL